MSFTADFSQIITPSTKMEDLAAAAVSGVAQSIVPFQGSAGSRAVSATDRLFWYRSALQSFQACVF